MRLCTPQNQSLRKWECGGGAERLGTIFALTRPAKTPVRGDHVLRRAPEGVAARRGPVPRAPARRAGVPAGTLRHWEGGRGFPGLAACLRLAKALGVSVERLAQGVEDPADEEPESAPQKPRRKRRGKPP
jgi:hypothetical protein